MIKTNIAYLHKKFVVVEEEPSTIAELSTLIGEDGTVVNAVANLRYRNKNPRVYKRVSMEVEKLGFVKSETHKDEMAHIRAFLTTDSANEKVLADLFTRVALEEPLFIRGDRIGGGRVAQGALDAAHRYFAEGDKKVSEAVETIEQMLPTYRVGRDAEGHVTPENLARGIQTLQRHLQSKAKAVVQNL